MSPDSAYPHSNWRVAEPSLPSSLKAYWLQRPGALTAGLRQLGHVDLRVINEYASTLPPDEAALLQRSENSDIWVREIVMAIASTDCVVARSVTPLSCSNSAWKGMRHLQTRPLADMLYHDPEVTRSSFYTSQLHAQQPLYETVQSALAERCPKADELVARCSVFWRYDEPLLVAECFLPDFWTLAQQDGDQSC